MTLAEERTRSRRGPCASSVPSIKLPAGQHAVQNTAGRERLGEIWWFFAYVACVKIPPAQPTTAASPRSDSFAGIAREPSKYTVRLSLPAAAVSTVTAPSLSSSTRRTCTAAVLSLSAANSVSLEDQRLDEAVKAEDWRSHFFGWSNVRKPAQLLPSTLALLALAPAVTGVSAVVTLIHVGVRGAQCASSGGMPPSALSSTSNLSGNPPEIASN